MINPIVGVRGVSKSYHRGPETVHALSDVDFDLVGGEVVALVGPSGSGKTTLLNILYGWEHPDEGEVVWGSGGVPGARDWDEASVIPQRLGLLDELTIFENVELPLTLFEISPQEASDRVNEMLVAVGIDHIANHHPRETSLGEQQRTAVARALVTSPLLVLADEPTGHQDAESERLIFRAFRSVAARGGICLIATHNPEAIRFCHRVLRVEDGLLAVEAGVTEEELDRELSPFARHMDSGFDRPAP